MCPRRKQESSPHTWPFWGILSSFSQWVYLTPGCISVSSRIFRRGLGYAKVASFFTLRPGSSVSVQRSGSFACSGVWSALFPVSCARRFSSKRRPSFRPILFNCVTPASQLDPAFCKRLKTKTCGSRTCKPNSVCRCRQDDHSSGPRITAGLKRPTRRLWRAEPARVPGEAEASPRNPSLFGLAPCGVCPARCITAAAVRSYRTFSPLPEPCGPSGMFSVALSVEPA